MKFIITQKYTVGCEGSAGDQIIYQIQGSALLWHCFLFVLYYDSWKIRKWRKIGNNYRCMKVRYNSDST